MELPQTCAVLTKNDTVQSHYPAFLSVSLSVVWNVQKSLPFLTPCGFHSSNLPRSVITVLSVWSSYFSWSSPAHPLGPESYVTFSKAASPDHSGRLDGSGLCVPQWFTFFVVFTVIFLAIFLFESLASSMDMSFLSIGTTSYFPLFSQH